MRWLVVTSPENFALTEGLGFTVQGFKERHRRKVLRMGPGDELAYYLIREGTFAAACRVTSVCFEGRQRIWYAPGKPDERYPYRVQIKPELVVPLSYRPRARDFLDRLAFARPWPPERRQLAFQGMVHLLADSDAALIRAALQEGWVRSGGSADAESPECKPAAGSQLQSGRKPPGL
jgi:hypothetical protein